MKKLINIYSQTFFLQILPYYLLVMLFEAFVEILGPRQSDTIYLSLIFNTIILIFARQWGFLVSSNLKRHNYVKLYVVYSVSLGIINVVASFIILNTTKYKLQFLRYYVIDNQIQFYFFTFLLSVGLILIMSLLVLLFKARLGGPIILAFLFYIVIYVGILPELIKVTNLVIIDLLVICSIIVLIRYINRYSQKINLEV